MRKARRAAYLLVISCSAGCALHSRDPATAVEVRLENRASFPITVQAVRSVAIVDFEATVAGHSSGRFRVSHRAFGNGPVRFHVSTGVGRFRRGYRTRDRLRVPAGGLVVITLEPDIPASMIVVYDQRPAGAVGRRSPS